MLERISQKTYERRTVDDAIFKAKGITAVFDKVLMSCMKMLIRFILLLARKGDGWFIPPPFLFACLERCLDGRKIP